MNQQSEGIIKNLTWIAQKNYETANTAEQRAGISLTIGIALLVAFITSFDSINNLFDSSNSQVVSQIGFLSLIFGIGFAAYGIFSVANTELPINNIIAITPITEMKLHKYKEEAIKILSNNESYINQLIEFVHFIANMRQNKKRVADSSILFIITAPFCFGIAMFMLKNPGIHELVVLGLGIAGSAPILFILWLSQQREKCCLIFKKIMRIIVLILYPLYFGLVLYGGYKWNKSYSLYLPLSVLSSLITGTICTAIYNIYVVFFKDSLRCSFQRLVQKLRNDGNDLAIGIYRLYQ